MKLIKNIAFLILLLVIISGCMGGGRTLVGDVLKESPGTGSDVLEEILGGSDVLKKSPGTGSLDVISIPIGADIFIDGNYMGKSNINLTNIVAGTHDVVLKKEGYRDSVSKITIVLGPGWVSVIGATLAPIDPDKEYSEYILPR